jgi:acetyl esterase/lipase
MRKSAPVVLLGIAVFAGLGAAASPEPIALWPKGAPGEPGNIGPEQDTSGPTGGKVAGRYVIRLGNVTNPTITVFRPPRNRDSGAAVVVFPGGGYRILAWNLEGTEICAWLNSIGVTGVLLKYRVPAREGGPRYRAPLQDAQRAVGMVRWRATGWGIDPKRIGVLGFSAGGHLAAAISNNYSKRTYDRVDEADEVSCRPDFAVVLYPGYLAIKEEGDKLAPEMAVTPATPPTFLMQAEDDGVRVENALVYYAALKAAKVPAEMHLYATGGHGYGLRDVGKPVTAWPKRAEEWMRGLGVIH